MKFRIWLKDPKKYAVRPDYLSKITTGGEIIVGPTAIMEESTGIYDSKGVEIFEGDILRGTCCDYYRNGEIMTIRLIKTIIRKTCCGFRLYSHPLSNFVVCSDYSDGRDKTKLDCYCSYEGNILLSNISKIHVIGNIHENPELTK
jgi:uncharacterized phage protein (TIGR01671 family)